MKRSGSRLVPSFVVTLVALSVLGCGSGSGDLSATGGDTASTGPPTATPVRVATVERAKLVAEVLASGRTEALVEQKIRAPFDGTVTELGVVEGDRVRKGQSIGTLVARDSEAALRGAEEMARVAGTDREREDARRALELARGSLVSSALRATVDGRVTARAAAVGDRVTADQELLSIADVGSVIFRADVPHAELSRIHAGQTAAVELSGRPAPVPARVHGLLTPEAGLELTASVRLDLVGTDAVLTPGLYGVARIAVEEHRDVPVVPRLAVLRDDVAGTARVGTIDDRDRLHWVEVTTGLEDSTRVEILAPPLEAGTRVVVSGQLGLTEGTVVEARPADVTTPPATSGSAAP